MLTTLRMKGGAELWDGVLLELVTVLCFLGTDVTN